MPLFDHFHQPFSEIRHWESFHTLWIGVMTLELNRSLLPPGYFAEAQVDIGEMIEIDLRTVEGEERSSGIEGKREFALQTWSAPDSMLQMPAVFPEDLEIRIFRNEGGATLVAAIELVSPGNKDRPESRRAFAAKCAAYLQRGIGLVIVDVVTERHANLHDELIDLMGQPESLHFPGESLLYAVSYRPTRTQEEDRIELWTFPLAVGQTLPVAPLPLLRGPTLPLDLETTYMETRKGSKM